MPLSGQDLQFTDRAAEKLGRRNITVANPCRRVGTRFIEMAGPINDHDPNPQEYEAWLEEHEAELEWIEVPPHSHSLVIAPQGVSDEEWKARQAAAHARGERLPEEIVADEEMMAARAEEERDWTPQQKQARRIERETALAKIDRMYSANRRLEEVHPRSNGDFDQLGS